MDLIFTNHKTSDWLSFNSKEELEKLVDIARKNKHDRIKKCKRRKEEILTFKIEKNEKSEIRKRTETAES